jgi:hypothetical protein
MLLHNAMGEHEHHTHRPLFLPYRSLIIVKVTYTDRESIRRARGKPLAK